MNEITFDVSIDACDVVVNGYCDAIDNEEQHKLLCELVDGKLPKGYYWLSACEQLRDTFGKCEITGMEAELWKVTARKS
jgi:hypothetical protein